MGAWTQEGLWDGAWKQNYKRADINGGKVIVPGDQCHLPNSEFSQLSFHSFTSLRDKLGLPSLWTRAAAGVLWMRGGCATNIVDFGASFPAQRGVVYVVNLLSYIRLLKRCLFMHFAKNSHEKCLLRRFGLFCSFWPQPLHVIISYSHW
jgi:hypothetical protein